MSKSRSRSFVKNPEEHVARAPRQQLDIAELLPAGYTFRAVDHGKPEEDHSVGGWHAVIERGPAVEGDEPEMLLHVPIHEDVADGTPGEYRARPNDEVRELVEARGVKPAREAIRDAIASGQFRPDENLDADAVAGSLRLGSTEGLWDGIDDWDPDDPDVVPSRVSRARFGESLREALHVHDVVLLLGLREQAFELERARRLEPVAVVPDDETAAEEEEGPSVAEREADVGPVNFRHVRRQLPKDVTL
jgi:hypothetical protein